jgi:hypothetical protein
LAAAAVAEVRSKLAAAAAAAGDPASPPTPERGTPLKGVEAEERYLGSPARRSSCPTQTMYPSPPTQYQPNKTFRCYHTRETILIGEKIHLNINLNNQYVNI